MGNLSSHLKIVSIIAIFSHLIFYNKPVQAGTLTDLYVFGDSSVDSGNYFDLTGEPGDPYFEGRFSNGKLYVELIPQKLGFSYDRDKNYAVAGARTDSHSLNEEETDNDRDLGFAGQVKTFLNETETVDEQALYVISVGGNDYIDRDFDPDGDGQITAEDSRSTIANITTTIRDLSDAGAKNFLVVGLFDYAKAPLILNSSYTEEQRRSISSLIGAHNENLKTSLTALSNVVTSFVDVNKAFDDNMDKFTNTEEACLSTDLACNTPDEYVFWDELHPTATANEVLADEIVKIVKAHKDGEGDIVGAAVPEPITFLGVAAAATFGLLFKRQLSNLPKDGGEVNH